MQIGALPCWAIKPGQSARPKAIKTARKVNDNTFRELQISSQSTFVNVAAHTRIPADCRAALRALCVETGNPTFHRGILFFWLIAPVNSITPPCYFLKGNRNNTLQHKDFSQIGGCQSANFAKCPVKYPVIREYWFRDRFVSDCAHHHPLGKIGRHTGIVFPPSQNVRRRDGECNDQTRSSTSRLRPRCAPSIPDRRFTEVLWPRFPGPVPASALQGFHSRDLNRTRRPGCRGSSKLSYAGNG
jgi:hypothetical protein